VATLTLNHNTSEPYWDTRRGWAPLARWVIGKEGSYIKQLEERSKAVVRISDSSSREYGREWKYVQLQGAPRAVDRAKSRCMVWTRGGEPPGLSR
jgi:hypothetical protein